MFAVSCLAEVTHYSGHGEIWRGKATFHDIFHVLIGVSVCVCVCVCVCIDHRNLLISDILGKYSIACCRCGRALDLQLTGHGFKSQPVPFHIT